MDNKVLDKVRKLLSLAESDNENEARIAMERANELLLRHNLSMQDVESHTDIIERTTGEEFQFSKAEDKFVISLLRQFFFVRAIYSAKPTGQVNSAGQRVRMQTLSFVGLPQNTEIAVFTYFYLVTSYRRLWLEYKRANGASEKARQAYYLGLTSSIEERLTAKKKQVETETGLVWVGDQAIAKYLSKMNLQSKGASKIYGNSQAQQAGAEAGKTLNLLQGLKSKPESTTSGKLLGGK